MTEGRKIAVIVTALVILLMALTPLGHCAVSKKHDNSLGVIQYTDNPLTYKEGYVVDGALVEDGDHAGVVMRIQPKATFHLFTEDIFFCDPQHVLEVMQGKANPVVLTYETQAHRRIKEIGCHNLIAIDEVKVPSEVK